jgi:hypothetical protein
MGCALCLLGCAFYALWDVPFMSSGMSFLSSGMFLLCLLGHAFYIFWDVSFMSSGMCLSSLGSCFSDVSKERFVFNCIISGQDYQTQQTSECNALPVLFGVVM